MAPRRSPARCRGRRRTQGDESLPAPSHAPTEAGAIARSANASAPTLKPHHCASRSRRGWRTALPSRSARATRHEGDRRRTTSTVIIQSQSPAAQRANPRRFTGERNVMGEALKIEGTKPMRRSRKPGSTYSNPTHSNTGSRRVCASDGVVGVVMGGEHSHKANAPSR